MVSKTQKTRVKLEIHVLDFRHQFYKKSRVQKSKIRLSSIVQLFFCEFDLVRLPIQWIAFDCVRWINSLEQGLCYMVSKTQKHVLFWSNTSLEKLVIDFKHQFYKKSRVQKSKVRFSSIVQYFCVSSIWFDCRTQSNSIHELSSTEFDWNTLRLGSIDYAGYNSNQLRIDVVLHKKTPTTEQAR